jgi:hypothetical protein
MYFPFTSFVGIPSPQLVWFSYQGINELFVEPKWFLDSTQEKILHILFDVWWVHGIERVSPHISSCIFGAMTFMG